MTLGVANVPRLGMLCAESVLAAAGTSKARKTYTTAVSPAQCCLTLFYVENALFNVEQYGSRPS
jgi:hypothetical protein